MAALGVAASCPTTRPRRQSRTARDVQRFRFIKFLSKGVAQSRRKNTDNTPGAPWFTARENASLVTAPKAFGALPRRRVYAGGACSRREAEKRTTTCGQSATGSEGRTGTSRGATGAGSQSECSTLPAEKSVAAHSCSAELPWCKRSCSCGAAERPRAKAMAANSRAPKTERDLPVIRETVWYAFLARKRLRLHHAPVMVILARNLPGWVVSQELRTVL